MAQMQACESCGSTIYPEHIDQGRAGRWSGQLLCAVCYAEKKGLPAQEQPAAAAPSPASQPEKDEPISLEDTPETEAAGSKIQAFSQLAGGIGVPHKQFNRRTAVTGQGACRIRTFHSKLQIESIEFMDNAINEWLEENPGVEVKFVNSTIGVMAGKHPEPNLILNIWY